MNSVIIFGGCGYIGINFAEFLLKKNIFEKIYLADVAKPTQNYTKLIFNKLLSAGNVTFVNIDIRDEITFSFYDKISLIVDFAAIHREPGHHEKEYFETNVNGSKNICKFANKINCKNIIFTSSISVYGFGDHEKSEKTEANPSTAYGKSKLIAEQNYINWQHNNLKKHTLTICRPGVVYGPGETGNVTRLIKIIKKGLFVYMGNRELKKGGIYIKELVNTIFWVNKKQLSGNFNNFEFYNATYYPCPSISNYVENILDVLNLKKKFFSFPRFFLKFLIYFTSLLTKNLNSNSNFHYTRLNKLFISNNIKPSFLIDKNYKYLYNIKNSFLDWKKTKFTDWK
jgi:nucleoside-diphosphate-sugar epimerase